MTVGNGLGRYNWTEVEWHDTSDLQLKLRNLNPFARYELLIQALNDFGAGPMEKAIARTKEDGESKKDLGHGSFRSFFNKC